MRQKINLLSLLKDFDPSAPPPKISSVAEGIGRPRWSIMIPTFNCANLLRQTLESVLSQDFGHDLMQIEVIDDCSTTDDPEAVVKEIGRGRVTFHRNEQNLGATSNFNVCIERSRGELVHILHGDDWVLPGFYTHLDAIVAHRPNASLYATRSFFVDEEGVITAVTNRVCSLENGGHSYSEFVTGTALQFAGIVVRREFYETHGGFRSSLVHCADWEMWVRAINVGLGVVSPQVLSSYRVFDSNDTGRLVKTAENLKDRLRLYAVLSHNIPEFPLLDALNNLRRFSAKQAHQLQSAGDTTSAEKSYLFFKQLQALLRHNKFRFLSFLN
jgi:glycosyltransferase involved in cell wall biosynthesis